MSPLDAFHLPGLGPADVLRWELQEYDDGTTLRIPVLSPDAVGRLCDRLRHARAEHLAARPARTIADAIGAAAERLLDPGDPARQTAERALPAVTGHSPPMVRLILDRMAADWRAGPLHALLRAELGDPELLDRFRPHPAGVPRVRTRALGPALAFQIFAGNVPGTAVTALVRALLVKAATLGKTGSDDPLLPALFARTLAETDPALGACLAVTYWPGGTTPLEDRALEAADTVVVYGGDDVAAEIRRRTPPGRRILVHGPRLSLALVAREALTTNAAPATAARLARATATFDQRGCVSPHVAYAETGGEVGPERFAELVATELDRLEHELPRGRLTPAEAARIHELRATAEFRELAGTGARTLTGAACTVIYDPDPAFTPSCLNRVLWVKPVPDLDDAARLLEPYAAYLQTVGLAAPPERAGHLAETLARTGASRITDLERMPWPPPAWHHDGQEPIRELVRWCDLEE